MNVHTVYFLFLLFRNDTDKENIPSRGLTSSASVSISISEDSERRLDSADEDSRPRKPKYSPTLTELSHNQGLLSVSTALCHSTAHSTKSFLPSYLAQMLFCSCFSQKPSLHSTERQ